MRRGQNGSAGRAGRARRLDRARALRRTWRAALDSQANGTTLAGQNEPRDRCSLGLGRAPAGTGRESEAGRARSAAEIGTMSPESGLRRDCVPRVTTSSKDASEASCTASCRSNSDGHGPRESQIAQNGSRETQAHSWETTRSRRTGDSGTGKPGETQGKGAREGPDRD